MQVYARVLNPSIFTDDVKVHLVTEAPSQVVRNGCYAPCYTPREIGYEQNSQEMTRLVSAPTPAPILLPELGSPSKREEVRLEHMSDYF